MTRLFVSFLLIASCCLPSTVQTDKPQHADTGESTQPPAWPQEPNGFKGVQFGWTREQAESVMHMPCLPPVNDTFFCGTIIIDGGGFSMSARFVFESTGLTHIIGKFPSENYQEVKEMFTAKYGKPHTVSQSKLQNHMGAKFQQEDLLWIGKRVYVSVSRYGTTLTDGSFSLGLTSSINSGEEGRKALRDKALQ